MYKVPYIQLTAHAAEGCLQGPIQSLQNDEFSPKQKDLLEQFLYEYSLNKKSTPSTSIGSISLAVEGDLDLEWRWDLLSSSRDGVLDNVKFSTESI